jgi:hypothetical protein
MKDNYKKCPKCKEIKKFDEFHMRKKDKIGSYCKRCLYDFQMERWKDRKRKAVQMFGGKCSKCGYDKNLSAFDFHHIDANTKEYSWDSLRSRKWETIVFELKKCILLCCRCHREEHSPECNLKLEPKGNHNRSLNVDDFYWLEPTGKCKICDKDVYGTKYCSVTCARKANRKVKNRPSKETILEMLKTESFVSVGKKYGVSDNAIRKWINV